MKAILLAAGKGSRISKVIPDVPKCTLDVGGTPLVVRTINMLKKHNIDVTIVVGYRHKVIEELLKDYDVNIVYNPFFDVTNSIGSLWMAKDSLVEEDTIVANADVFWDETLLETLLLSEGENAMLADSSRADDGDYFFLVEDGKLVKFGKELERDERNCEYVGIGFMRASFVEKFKQRLIYMVEHQKHGVWWENVFYSFIGDKDPTDVNVIDVNGKFWAEIDFIEDYHRIVDFVTNKN